MKVKKSSAQSLRQTIRMLLLRLNVIYHNLLRVNLLPDEMAAYVNVLAVV